MNEQRLYEDLESIFQKNISEQVKIIVPELDDAASVQTWNDLRSSLTGSVHAVDSMLVALRKKLDTFDENSNTYAKEITVFVQRALELLVTTTVSPDEERFLERFQSDESFDPSSNIGWDKYTKALSLPIEQELPMNASISAINIDFGIDTTSVRRNLGHLAGHVEQNADNFSILEPDDRINLNTNPNVLLDPTSHNTVEVEQVILLKDRYTSDQPEGDTERSSDGVNFTGKYIVDKYSPAPFRTTPIPISETILWSRPPIESVSGPHKVTISARFNTPVNINKIILIQQPINGILARLDKVSVSLPNGRVKEIQTFPESKDIMGNVFSEGKITGIKWELTQTYNVRSPISFQHWVADIPLGVEQHARHLFVESALVHQQFPTLDKDYQLAIMEKILGAGEPINELSDNQLPPWARRGPKLVIPDSITYIQPEPIVEI